MQKSAHPQKNQRFVDRQRSTPLSDKGQKFEPFWTLAFGSDARSLARQQKADQKR